MNGILQILSLRQSTRKFQSTPFPGYVIEKIIKAANRAPMGSNRHEDVHLTVVEDQEKLLSLRGSLEEVFIPNQNPGNSGRYRIRCNAQKIQSFLRSPPVIFISHRKQTAQPGIEWANVTVVTTIMHLEATNMGLGSVFMWGALESTRMNPELDPTSILEIPEEFAPLIALAIGYPMTPLEPGGKKHAPICVNYTDFRKADA